MIIDGCFDGLVGLRGLCESEETLVYINDLPGVEFRSFAAAATQEDVSGKELFNRLLRTASRQVSQDFISHLNKRKVNLVEVVDETEVGGFHKDDFHPMEESYVGQEIYVNSMGSIIKRRLDWVELKVKNYARKTIYVEVDGVKNHKFDVILQAGINKIPIDLSGDEIRVYISICDIEVAKQYTCGGSCSMIPCGYLKTIAKTELGDWESGNIRPFRLGVSCICDRSQIVCKYAQYLVDALQLKIAVLLMEEVLYSSNKSYFVRNSKENAERLITSIMGGDDPQTGITMKSKYWQAIGQGANAVIESLKGGPCVDCGGLSIVDSLP